MAGVPGDHRVADGEGVSVVKELKLLICAIVFIASVYAFGWTSTHQDAWISGPSAFNAFCAAVVAALVGFDIYRK